ncbi:MAG: glycosyltransferase family 9 protein [Thermodesulfobacteriota bacterium]
MRTDQVRKIAVHFQNGIGNWIMFTPSVQALKSLYPNATMTVVLDSGWQDNRKNAIRELVGSLDVVDKVIEYPKQSVDGYDLYFANNWGEPCDTHRLFVEKGFKQRQPEWRTRLIHETEFYMEDVYALGYRGPMPKQHVSVAAMPVVKKNGMRIGLCNGYFKDSGRWNWKRKAWDKFPELASVLKLYFDAEIVLFGNADELEGVEGDIDYRGKLKITETAKAISQCDLMVSSDSGLMHVADALEVPLVAIFGATLCSKNGPIQTKNVVVRSPVACAPCQFTFVFRACSDFVCMRAIQVGDVMAAVRQLIKD